MNNAQSRVLARARMGVGRGQQTHMRTSQLPRLGRLHTVWTSSIVSINTIEQSTIKYTHDLNLFSSLTFGHPDLVQTPWYTP